MNNKYTHFNSGYDDVIFYKKKAYVFQPKQHKKPLMIKFLDLFRKDNSEVPF